MFELTCPSCRDARPSPFIRIGAATRCPACGHTWRISASHIGRVKPAPQANPSPAPEPVAIDADPPAGDPREDSSVAGMSGLSDLMQAEPHAKPRNPNDDGPPIPEAKFASPEAAQRLAQSAAHLRQTQRPGAMSPQARRMAILIIAALAVVVAIVGVGLLMLGNDEGNLGNTAEDAADTERLDPITPDIVPAGPPAPPGRGEPGASRAPRLLKHAWATPAFSPRSGAG